MARVSARSLALVVLLVVGSLLACKKKSPDEQALETYREKGTARIAALDRVAAELKSAPPATADALQGAPYRYTAGGAGDNLAFLSAVAVANLGKGRFEQFELPNRLPVFSSAYYGDAARCCGRARPRTARRSTW
ncbi:MAG: hypothetical protein IT376_06260 [Polyangiaceae bacterium]|nr:hypothetical protein [Polyangiaceae bacterium]